MAHSTRTYRIIAASFVALLMVGGAYAFSGPNPLFGGPNVADAQSSEELLREYAAKDTDTDGLPDWQEALYGTDPTNPESFKAGTKDGDAVAQGLIEPKVVVRPEDEPVDIESIPGTAVAPTTLTDRFARALITQYLSSRGETPPTSTEIVAFVQKGIADLNASSAEPDHFSLADVVVSGAGSSDALIAYATQMQSAIAANTVPSSISARNELSYFQDAIRGDDASLAKIEAYSKAYKDMANALIKVRVPSEARAAHLAIVNATMHLSSMTADMAALKTDPLRALLGIGLYGTYAGNMKTGFASMHNIFEARQVQIVPGAPGYEFYNTSVLADTQ